MLDWEGQISIETMTQFVVLADNNTIYTTAAQGGQLCGFLSCLICGPVTSGDFPQTQMDKYNFSHDTDTLYTSLHIMIIHFYWYVATIHMQILSCLFYPDRLSIYRDT